MTLDTKRARVGVGQVLPHLRRHPLRLELLEESDAALLARTQNGDLVAGLVLALKPAQRVLIRWKLTSHPM